jgi:hypothetical protein
MHRLIALFSFAGIRFFLPTFPKSVHNLYSSYPQQLTHIRLVACVTLKFGSDLPPEFSKTPVELSRSSGVFHFYTTPKREPKKPKE